MLSRRVLLASPLAFAVSPARARGEPLRVAASFSILADLVRQIGGERVAADELVGPGGDAHAFQPSPADAAKLASARVIFVNGLGFDDWMRRLAASAGARSLPVIVSAAVTPRKGEDGHDLDPHAWQSVPDAKLYADAILAALSAADPDGAASYEGNALRLKTQLDALDAEIRAAVAALPPERRKVVTTHDAFGYFAAEYGVAFLAPKGVSNEAEASPRDVARIIRQIRQEKIPAVFLENVTDPRLMQRIAQETGAKIGGSLYSDSLTPPDGLAPSYVAMMRHNIRELSKALAP